MAGGQVAVVVPCRNEAATVAALLDSIARQSRPPDEVILVDDGSTDNTRAAIESWGARHPELPLRIIQGQGRGAGAAMNAGIAATSAEVIVRLDGHCQPGATYVARSLEALGTTRAGVAGGVWSIVPGAPSLTARAIAAVLSHPLGSGGADYRPPPGRADTRGARAVDTVPFGTFRKDLWAEIGGFDESLVRNQDYDFNYRVRLIGREVVLDPAIVSVYQARPTLRALARQYFEYGYWKVVMLRKFPASIRMRQLVPLLLAPLLLLALTWAAASRRVVPLAIPGAYLLLNALAAAHVSRRSGDIRLIPYAAAALTVLQTAWSAGAWRSVLAPPRPDRKKFARTGG